MFYIQLKLLLRNIKHEYIFKFPRNYKTTNTKYRIPSLISSCVPKLRNFMTPQNSNSSKLMHANDFKLQFNKIPTKCDKTFEPICLQTVVNYDFAHRAPNINPDEIISNFLPTSSIRVYANLSNVGIYNVADIFSTVSSCERNKVKSKNTVVFIILPIEVDTFSSHYQFFLSVVFPRFIQN